MYSNSYSAMARLTLDNNDNELPRIGGAAPQYALPSIKDTLSPPPLHHAHSYSHSYSSSTGTSTPSTSIHGQTSHGRSNSQSKPGPSRTGRPHSQSVSSMTSPYSYSTTPTSANGSSNTSFVNLRSSFMQQSPPSRYPDHPSRAALAESLHRHHSASSLPPNALYHHLHNPVHHTMYPEHDPPTTGPRKRRSSTTSNHAATITDRRGSGASDRLTMTGIGLGLVPHDDPLPPYNASPRGGARTSLMMTPNHSGGPGQPIQRRQGFAVPDAAQAGQASSDPSAVRRLAHLQCEQRRRE